MCKCRFHEAAENHYEACKKLISKEKDASFKDLICYLMDSPLQQLGMLAGKFSTFAAMLSLLALNSAVLQLHMLLRSGQVGAKRVLGVVTVRHVTCLQAHR